MSSYTDQHDNHAAGDEAEAEHEYDGQLGDQVDDGAGGDAGADAGFDEEESYLGDVGGIDLWPGDRGSLDAKQRDTLVTLLKKEFISSDDRSEWKTLIKDPGPIITSLNNMYLTLVVDERAEVAFTQAARTPDAPFKTLVRDTVNNREETILLIYLRERFRAEAATGQGHVFTDETAMAEYFIRLRPPSATDELADGKRVEAAIASLKSAGILEKTKDEGRYRIHRAIEALLPLSKLIQLLEAFKQVNNPPDAALAGEVDAEDAASSSSLDSGDNEPYRAKHAAPDHSAEILAAEEAAAAEQLGATDDWDETEQHTQADPEADREGGDEL